MAKRTNTYSFLIYPDDPKSEALFVWLEHDCKIPNAVSPVHDRDVTDSGELKKAHYHVVLMFHSLKSLPQVLEMVEPYGVQHVEAINDKRAYIRYLVHLDSPSKAQYDRKDIKTNFGAEIDDAFSCSPARVEDAKNELTAYVLDYNVTEYSSLVRFCLDKSSEYMQAVTKYSYHFNILLGSIRYDMR